MENAIYHWINMTVLRTLLICCLFYSGQVPAEIYKCKDLTGSIQMTDRPCNSGDETLSVTKQGELSGSALEFAKILARLVEEKLAGSTDPKAKQASELLIQVEALRVYAISRTFKVMLKGCAKVDGKLHREFKQSYDTYFNDNNDLLKLGRSLSIKGFSMPDGSMTVTPSEMEEGTTKKEREIEETFSHVTGSNRLKLEKQCVGGLQAINLMRQLSTQ